MRQNVRAAGCAGDTAEAEVFSRLCETSASAAGALRPAQARLPSARPLHPPHPHQQHHRRCSERSPRVACTCPPRRPRASTAQRCCWRGRGHHPIHIPATDRLDARCASLRQTRMDNTEQRTVSKQARAHKRARSCHPAGSCRAPANAHRVQQVSGNVRVGRGTYGGVWCTALYAPGAIAVLVSQHGRAFFIS